MLIDFTRQSPDERYLNSNTNPRMHTSKSCRILKAAEFRAAQVSGHSCQRRGGRRGQLPQMPAAKGSSFRRAGCSAGLPFSVSQWRDGATCTCALVPVLPTSPSPSLPSSRCLKRRRLRRGRRVTVCAEWTEAAACPLRGPGTLCSSAALHPSPSSRPFLTVSFFHWYFA